MTELKRCPFCGVDTNTVATIPNAPIELHSIICHSCGGMVPRATEAEAIAAWNTRPEPASFQARVGGWMEKCFTPGVVNDGLERCDRFIEEALELVQAKDYSAARAHALVDYVFARPKGETAQEVGGVMVTLAAACNVFGVDIALAAESELARINSPETIEKIRTKQASKPTGSALPEPAPSGDMVEQAARALCEKYWCGNCTNEQLPRFIDSRWTAFVQGARAALSIPALAEVREALAEAEETFRFYEQSHLAKKTLDGDAKAFRNAEMADKMAQALAKLGDV